jgi:hypothetical protein
VIPFVKYHYDSRPTIRISQNAANTSGNYCKQTITLTVLLGEKWQYYADTSGQGDIVVAPAIYFALPHDIISMKE